jgi:mono/diheme cytochrome c family protein
MTYKLLVCSAALTLAAGASVMGQDANIQRGKYVVEEVARCQECHSPKLASGDFDRAKWLKGATLNVAPISPIAGWHATSPDITSTSALWQRWGDDGMAKFLETAANPRGGKAGAPMPAYHISHEDAVAVVAYLKSLP